MGVLHKVVVERSWVPIVLYICVPARLREMTTWCRAASEGLRVCVMSGHKFIFRVGAKLAY